MKQARKLTFIYSAMGAPEFTLRGHIWLECESGLEIGPGRAALLEQIHDLGSIRKAADALGLTYRQAWARVKAMNTSADCQLVQRTSGGVNGGGASLTKQGRSILEVFQQQDQRFQNYLLEEIPTRKNVELPHMDPFLIFYFVLLIVAFFYASVGHGGASGYLAVMALFGLAPEVMRPSALVLNVIVASLAFYQYLVRGYFRKELFLPFALGSIPASFIGGTIDVDPVAYKRILGVFLVLAVARMLWQIRQKEVPFHGVKWGWAILVGAGIGLFSGMIGIGGGIILSPVILLLHWADMKETAAVSALFILVNSLAALAGMVTDGLTLDPHMPWMILAAFGGGLAGSYLGARRFGHKWLRYLLAAVLLVAAVKLILI